MQKLLIIILTAAAIAAANGESIAVGFSNSTTGNNTSLPLVLQTINGAHKSIYMATYSFTSKPIAEALAAAYKRGVDVKIVSDQKANGAKYTAVTYLANAGVPIRTNGNYAIFHNKFMVIDGQTVETGSFNYTAAAWKSNAENAIVISGNPQLAAVYFKEWQGWYNEATPVAARY